jgi:ubiquinone biosynthesis protein
LLHQSLQPKSMSDQRMLEALLLEQRRTNRLLQAILLAGAGFIVGIGVMLLASHFAWA